MSSVHMEKEEWMVEYLKCILKPEKVDNLCTYILSTLSEKTSGHVNVIARLEEESLSGSGRARNLTDGTSTHPNTRAGDISMFLPLSLKVVDKCQTVAEPISG